MSSRLTDGHPTKIDFSAGGVTVYETSVTPPGIDGGGPNNTTTMRNTTWRTNQPKKLKTLTPATMTVQYSPEAYNQLLAMINVNQLITVTFSDASTYKFWGWVNSFMPGEHSEGSPPTATITIEISNQNASQVETPPVLAG
jgi:hypothetical protein